MSFKKLFGENELKVLNEAYHLYISKCIKNNRQPHLEEFFDDLRKKNDFFNNFNNKQISNKIIASRNKFGSNIWPNLNDLENYISPTSKTFINKSTKSALLAVEIYNKPTVDYRTEGYIVMMSIAWTSLFHAIFSKDGKPFKYKTKANEEEKYFELTKCLSKYSGKYKKEIEANLLFLTQLRDQIVHKIIPDLDDVVFGECQACLYNFEQLANTYFGTNYHIKNSLAYSLQFSKKFTNEQLKAKRAYELKSNNSVFQFIEKYRANLDPEIFQSINYSFRVFMIPKVGNHVESSDLAVEFINYNPDNKTEYESYEKLLYVIRDKRVPGEFLKAGDVAKQVYENLKPFKQKGWKFSASYHHARCTKYFKIRVGHYSGEPEKTNGKYCIFDPTFNQHIYTKEWVEFLSNKLKDKELYKRVMSTK